MVYLPLKQNALSRFPFRLSLIKDMKVVLGTVCVPVHVGVTAVYLALWLV